MPPKYKRMSPPRGAPKKTPIKRAPRNPGVPSPPSKAKPRGVGGSMKGPIKTPMKRKVNPSSRTTRRR